jgi:hypothetical protein
VRGHIDWHVQRYLDDNARRGPLYGRSVCSYLVRALPPRSGADCVRILRDMERTLECRAASGEVIPLPAGSGETAYHRTADIRWPVTVPAGAWLRVHERRHTRAHLHIDCPLHGRERIGTVCGSCVAAALSLTRDLGAALETRTIVLDRPRRPSTSWGSALAALLLEAAQEIAARPSEPMEDDDSSPLPLDVTIGLARPALARAAAAIHAQDCLHAKAVIQAVEFEIGMTGRAAEALRSAADLSWVALRVLETAWTPS